MTELSLPLWPQYRRGVVWEPLGVPFLTTSGQARLGGRDWRQPVEAKPRCYWLAQGVLGSREHWEDVKTAPCNYLFHEITEKIARSWLRKDTRTNWIERPDK